LAEVVTGGAGWVPEFLDLVAFSNYGDPLDEIGQRSRKSPEVGGSIVENLRGSAI